MKDRICIIKIGSQFIFSLFDSFSSWNIFTGNIWLVCWRMSEEMSEKIWRNERRNLKFEFGVKVEFKFEEKKDKFIWIIFWRKFRICLFIWFYLILIEAIWQILFEFILNLNLIYILFNFFEARKFLRFQCRYLDASLSTGNSRFLQDSWRDLTVLKRKLAN